MADHDSDQLLIIAEPGSTHGGDVEKMREMVLLAARMGADAIKFQWVSNPEKLASRRHAQEYLESYRTLCFEPKLHGELVSSCADAGIEYLCTTYLPEDVAWVVPHVSRFKVSSFEAHDWPFIEGHFRWGKPVLVSTGMLDESTLAFWRLRRAQEEGYVKLLHCVSAYPCPSVDMHLSVIRKYHYDGWSDHSANPMVGALAVIAGAKILEVHFRHHDTPESNPDYLHSLTPHQLEAYCYNARYAWSALGDGEKRCRPSEQRWERYRVSV